MNERICPVCGSVFKPAYISSKYCSEECRRIGTENARKSWEQRSGYREKQRQRMAQIRQERGEAIREATNIRKRNLAEEEAQRVQRRQQHRQQLEDQAAAGDPLSIMILAKEAGNWPEYWKSYKAYEIQLAKERGEDCSAKVNGIPVTDPDFEVLVIYSIENEKRIYIESR